MSDENHGNGHSHTALWFMVACLALSTSSKGCRLSMLERKVETMQTQQAAEAEERQGDETR